MNSGGGRSEEKKEHLKREKKKFILIFIITHSLALALGNQGNLELQGTKGCLKFYFILSSTILDHILILSLVFLMFICVHKLDWKCQKG